MSDGIDMQTGFISYLRSKDFSSDNEEPVLLPLQRYDGLLITRTLLAGDYFPFNEKDLGDYRAGIDHSGEWDYEAQLIGEIFTRVFKRSFRLYEEW